MIPRGVPDIGWLDLMSGLVAPVLPRVAASTNPAQLKCLSARTGFDLVLTELALPHGSEVMVSAVTIPDMIKLIELHGLVAIPVDVDPDTLAVIPEALEKAVSSRSRAILIAHLFGSRNCLGPIMRFAKDHNLFVFEDCAQAFDGGAYHGHPEADCSFFSFGPIKTATALGGAIVRLRDPVLLRRVAERQLGFPVQPSLKSLKRVMLFGILKLLTIPSVYRVFVGTCRLLEKDHDLVIVQSIRGFSGPDLLSNIRKQPSKVTERLLARRMSSDQGLKIAKRVLIAEHLRRQLNESLTPGNNADLHTHWVVPVISRDPLGLVSYLAKRGFDATTRGSSLCVVKPPADRPGLEPVKARMLLASLVYLPCCIWLDEALSRQLATLVSEFESGLFQTAKRSEMINAAQPIG